MNRANSRPFMFSGLVVVTVFVGLLLTVYPIPFAYMTLRPEFMCLIAIYWVITTPGRMGVAAAFIFGLLQDIVEGNIWGAHALATCIVGYICLVSQQRIHNYPLWQQSFWVFILVGMQQVVVNWVLSLNGYSHHSKHLLLPTLMSAVLWPIIYTCLHRIRRAYGV